MKSKIHSTTGKKGFTIIEFLLSTAYFSFILMLVLAGFMQITRTYVRGVTTNKVHQAGRNMIEMFASEMKTASSASINPRTGEGSDDDKFCVTIGGNKYVFVAVDPSNPSDTNGQIFKYSNSSTCADFTGVAPQGLADKQEVSVQYFAIKPVTGAPDLYVIYLALSSGNYANDLLDVDLPALEASLENSLASDSSTLACTGGARGGEYCDVVFLRETVSIRN